MRVPSLRASVVAPLALVEWVNIINRRASHGLRIVFDKISEHNLHLCCHITLNMWGHTQAQKHRHNTHIVR